MEKTFEIIAAPEPPARLLIIPDVHGCRSKLERLLEMLSPTTGDTFLFLGDMVDKGPDSLGTLKTIYRLSSLTRTVLLRGNHEQALLSEHARGRNGKLDSLCASMGSEDLADGDFSLKSDVLEMLLSTVFYAELPHGYAVHAGMNFSAGNPLADTGYMMNVHSRSVPARYAGLRLVCGHRSMPVSAIKRAVREQAPVLALDNGCYIEGRADFGRLVCYDYAGMCLYVPEDIEDDGKKR